MWKIIVALITGIIIGVGSTIMIFRNHMSNVSIFGTVKYQKPFETQISDGLYLYPGGYYIETRVYFEPGAEDIVGQHKSFSGYLSTTSKNGNAYISPKITLPNKQRNEMDGSVEPPIR